MGPAQKKSVIATTTDSLGRRITLTRERWEHILDGHPEMAGLEMAIMRVVESADERRAGNFAGSEKIYAKGLGPARWLVAVVEYQGVTGRIITAHPSSKEPPPA